MGKKEPTLDVKVTNVSRETWEALGHRALDLGLSRSESIRVVLDHVAASYIESRAEKLQRDLDAMRGENNA